MRPIIGKDKKSEEHEKRLNIKTSKPVFFSIQRKNVSKSDA